MSTVSYLYVEIVLVFGACLGKSGYTREGKFDVMFIKVEGMLMIRTI